LIDFAHAATLSWGQSFGQGHRRHTASNFWDRGALNNGSENPNTFRVKCKVFLDDIHTSYMSWKWCTRETKLLMNNNTSYTYLYGPTTSFNPLMPTLTLSPDQACQSAQMSKITNDPA